MIVLVSEEAEVLRYRGKVGELLRACREMDALLPRRRGIDQVSLRRYQRRLHLAELRSRRPGPDGGTAVGRVA